MKIAVIGGTGQLGSDLVECATIAGHDVVSLGHDDIQVEDPDSVKSVLAGCAPDVVFNCAAFHNVPQCEEQPGKTFDVNAVGALNLAAGCREIGATNVYFSTDYVFDGFKGEPYVEDDAPNPLNVYAASKTAGEQLSLNYCDETLVVRISGIYGKVPCRAKGNNFVSMITRVAREKPEVRVVTDEVLTPTPTADIARKCLEMIDAGGRGLFHLSCEGQCSWYEFTQEIFQELDIETPLLPASVADFPSPVKRPHYSVLENKRIAELGVVAMPDWRDALRAFLASEYAG